MIYLELKENDNLVFTNIPEGYKATLINNKNSKKNNIRSFFKQYKDTTIWLITNDKDLYKSSKLFNKTFNLIEKITNGLYDHYSLVTLSNTHTITTIQAKMSQQLESLIGDVNQRGKYQESISTVQNKIKTNLNETAKLICDFNKRVEEIDTHLKSLEILTNKTAVKLDSHPLKTALLNIYSPFKDKFDSEKIKLIFERVPQNSKIKIDYKIFSLVMHHFFDNATKYSKSSDDIEFIFSSDNKLVAKMHSLTIKDKIKVFEAGYSGDNVGELAGNGIGMNVIKKGLLIMNMNIEITDTGNMNKDAKYSKNTFVITCNKA